MEAIVDVCGEGVEDTLRGRRVAELTVTGSYAEYMCLPTSRLVPVPDVIGKIVLTSYE